MSAAGLFVTSMALVILFLLRQWSIERFAWNSARKAREQAFRKINGL